MTSFGATKIVQNNDGPNFQTTFKIQGQVHHQIGPLLPIPNEAPKFLLIKLMSDGKESVIYGAIIIISKLCKK